MDCKYCIDDLNFTVMVADIATKCKYHKKKGAVYSASSVAPAGLCRELFYVAYPSCLALLYSGKPVRGLLRKKGVQRAIVSCPESKGIKIEVKVEEIFIPPLRAMKEFTEELCKFLFRPLDGHFRKIKIEVVETGFDCPKGYHIGDTFQFNTNKEDELCPAGFATIYPYLRFQKDINNNISSQSMKVHCPDYVGVTYEILVQ